MAGYRHLEIVQDFEKYVKDKKTAARAYYRYFLTRLQRMFQYKNLPDTIPHEILDRYLFENGICLITKVNDKLYAFSGNLGGPQDVYYRPTEFIVANPHIKVNGEIFSANIPVFECPADSDTVGQPTGVLIRNDTEWVGLHPLLSRYSYLMAENILTLRTADVMLRIIALLTAKTDAERASALEYLKSIEKGELGVIGESSFHEGVEMQSPPSNNGSYLTQFIEYQQYLKGSFYNEIGLSANYNMKREAIGKGESTLDEDALLPLCDNMLKTRKEDLQKVNDMFGCDISVEFSSAWLENRIEELSVLSQMQSTPSTPLFHPTEPDAPVGQPTEEKGVDESGNGDESSRGEVEGSSGGVESSRDGNESNSSESETNEQRVDTVDEQDQSTEEQIVSGDERDGDGTDGTEGDESKINDLSVDENLTNVLENIEDNLDKPMEQMDIMNPTNPLVNQEEKGGEEDDSTESERGSDDKASVSGS